MADLTLDEFEQETLQEVGAFFEMWRDEMEANPSEFPAKMGAGDWFEQLLTHLTSTADPR